MTEVNNVQVQKEEQKTTLEFVLAGAKIISDRKNFASFCETRPFEDEVNGLVKQIKFSSQLKTDIEEYISANKKKEKALCFVLFFTLYTILRKNKIGDLKEYEDKYINEFKEYDNCCAFIKLLTLYNSNEGVEKPKNVINYAKALLRKKELVEHSGIINLYVEATCAYYEANLEEREIAERELKDAKEEITKLISQDAYSKYLLNKGRLEVLLGEYVEAEKDINNAIKSVPIGEGRERTVQQYEHYLSKLNMIKLYDQNDVKIKEVEKIKTDNLKSMSLITALLAFILGTINVFSEVKDPQILVKLMVAYFGLVVVLLGVLLLGIRVIYREKKNKFLNYSVAVLLAGIIVFAVACVLIW